MAEFQVVVKQAQRMCEARDECTDCPLNELLHACGGDKDLDCIATLCEGEAEFAERSIMKWAANNPEPRHLSWNEAWKQLFPDSGNRVSPCPQYFLGNSRVAELCSKMECNECRDTPIPADIAEKLGIKPMGG